MIIKRVGGKAKIANWIASSTPPCEIFVDVFGGSGAVLDAVATLRGDDIRYVFNDLDEKLFAFFKALRDQPHELAHHIALTPYSRQEFEEAYKILKEDVSDIDTAIAFLIVNRQSFGSKMEKTWSITRDGEVNYETWNNIPQSIIRTHRRWKNVFLENFDYRKVLQKWDSEKTVFYLDPPYEDVEDIYYRVNKEDGFDHLEMLESLKGIKGSFCVSYYAGKDVDSDSELLKMYSDMGCEIRRKTVTKHLSNDPKKAKAVEALIIKTNDWASKSGWSAVRTSRSHGKIKSMKELE